MKSFFEKASLVVASHRHFQSLKVTQYDRQKIEEVQINRLRKLLDFCYRHVKYYQEIFHEKGITPQSFQSLEDLSSIPILTKQQIRERFWDFLPKELPRCRVYRTSGSSGIPICILSDESSRTHNSAAIIRYRKIYGMKNFSTPILTPLKKESEPIQNPHWTYAQGIHKTFYMNPYAERQGQINLGVRAIETLKKPAIIGITPAIRALAHQIKDGIYPSISPVAVLTVGESLNSQTRNLLEDVFKTKVYDTYACSEAGDIAWQCPQSLLYHVNVENCIFEILNENNDPVEEGEVGEVAITNLNRFSMPFIRYKNGDMARASYQQCLCGRKLSVFKEIIGRSGDDFHLPDGKKLQWNVLKSAMNHNLIRQFQLIQNQNASVTVKYIPEHASKTKEVEDVLNERFTRLLPSSLSISYEVVQKIPQASSGKSKLVLCNYHP